MDFKEKAEEIFNKIKSDKNIKAKFEKEPVKTVEEILGINLPDELIEKIIDTVKTKLTAENVSGIASKLGGILGKKD